MSALTHQLTTHIPKERWNTSIMPRFLRYRFHTPMCERPPFICSGVGARPQSGPSAPGRIPIFRMISHPFRETDSRAEICRAHAKRYELLQQRV